MPESSILAIINFGHRKLSKEYQIRALVTVDEEKLIDALSHYQALEQYEICETIQAVLDVKKFEQDFPEIKKKLDC